MIKLNYFIFRCKPLYSLFAVFSSVFFALPAMAGDAPVETHAVRSNIGLVSNYVFRGIGQSSSNPAIQGGMDYAHASGLYAGLWGSPVSWISDKSAVDTAQYGNPTTEVDIYFGYKRGLATNFSYDFGFIRYNYLGNYTPAAGSALADTAEIYAALHYNFITAKYSYSVLDQFMTMRNTRGTNYMELDARYFIPETDYSLSVHIGRQSYTGVTADSLETEGKSPSYTDYMVSAAKTINAYVFSVAYSNTNASAFYTHAKTIGGNWAGPTTLVSLTHTF